MRVVLDTNVLLSALISSKSTSEIIYRAWREARFELVTSVEQLDELRRVSRYPKFKAILPPHRIGAMVNNMQDAIILKDLRNKVQLNDPNDAFLVAMAISGKADYLVTVDQKSGLFQLGHVGRARIVTPSAFCDEALG